VEYFNGRGTRKLPTSAIDFEDLNPWKNADFQQGEAGWDKSLWEGQTRWHEMMSQALDYAFVSDPEVRFVRKIYQAGGSDAHGDFNFSTGRAATPLNVQATYNVGDEAWYGVRTYCLGDDKGGATPQERWLEAYADGNSVTTDGPLASLTLDADGRFDTADLRWHDAAPAYEDADGRIGGDGPLDGGYTALVRRGSDAPVFGYRYTSTPEFGPVASVLLYKTEAGKPNPTRTRPSGFMGFSAYEQILGVNEMALAGPDLDLEQPLDPTQEGTVDGITAFALGAFTGGNPDQVDLGPDNYRCYTNPVFAVPYDVDITVASTAGGEIAAGDLQVELRFDISMDPGAYAVEVKGLDANGDSTGKSDPALTALVPRAGGGSGWADQPGIKNSLLTLVNQDPISLNAPNYPSQGQVTFVVYFRDAPRDAAGNRAPAAARPPPAAPPPARRLEAAAGAGAAAAPAPSARPAPAGPRLSPGWPCACSPPAS
jgi:hypothetical protein